MFDFLQICLRKAKPVCKIPHMLILADVWLLPNMFGKNQTRWYIYTWVLFSTHVWILTHMYGKRHTCVKKATQLYVCKCLPFSTHVWEKPLTCLFPPELSVYRVRRHLHPTGQGIPRPPPRPPCHLSSTHQQQALNSQLLELVWEGEFSNMHLCDDCISYSSVKCLSQVHIYRSFLSETDCLFRSSFELRNVKYFIIL